MRITFVGHSTVLIELDGVRILTDPLLRRRFVHVSRRVPPVDPARFAGADVVLVSHIHHDHLDPASLRKLGPIGTVVLPRGARRLLRRVDAGDVQEVVEGDKVSIAGLEIQATHADHRPGRIRHRGPASMGFTIAGSKRLYFAGDTDLFAGMRDLAGGLDVAFLPIAGWGSRLGPGHLDATRAAEALTLLEPRIAIPIHWGTFYAMGSRRARPEVLAEPALSFAREAKSLAAAVDVRVLAPGKSTVVDGD
jgi:L-ascorbate metabolism protein UlaG (beta-lactamase superfamily)